MKTFTYVIAPEGCFYYLTAGKKYPVTNIDFANGLSFFETENDDKYKLRAISKGCPHLDFKNWIIPEIAQWPEGWTAKQKLDAICEPNTSKWRERAQYRIDHREELRKENKEKLDRLNAEYERNEGGWNFMAPADSDYQGRTQQQVEGSEKIFVLCLLATLALITAFVLFDGFFVSL